MALRQMRKMSAKGDELVAEYDTKTTTKERLLQIEEEFNRMMKAGFFAADITDKKDEQIRAFDPNADILMIPRMVGG